MKALTARQQEVFDLIRDHISQTGYATDACGDRAAFGVPFPKRG